MGNSQIELIQIQLSKKNKVFWKEEQTKMKKEVSLSHNRKKNYLLDEATPYPFLVRLGVQTPDGKVKKQKYDKFRQINRFLEFIDDSLRLFTKRSANPDYRFWFWKVLLNLCLISLFKNRKRIRY